MTYVIAEGPPLDGRDAWSSPARTARSGPRLRSAESWGRFVRTEQGPSRPGRRGRAPRAGRQHRALVPGPRLSVRVRASTWRGSTARPTAPTSTCRWTPASGPRCARVEVDGQRRRFPSARSCASFRSAPGDWYDARASSEGASSSPRWTSCDSPAWTCRATRPTTRASSSCSASTESQKHLIKGKPGYISSGGLTSQATWTDRSWLGGLRTFTVAATAQTGIAALENPAQELYRLNLTAFQPYVGDRRSRWRAAPSSSTAATSGTGAGRSGFEGSLVVGAGAAPLAVARLLDLAPPRVSTTASAPTCRPRNICPCSASPTPGSGRAHSNKTRNRSVLTLEGSYGRLDRIANPRKGYVIRPRIETTLPGFNTSEYFLMDLGRDGLRAASKTIGFTLRGGAGRIYPRGKSVTEAGRRVAVRVPARARRRHASPPAAPATCAAGARCWSDPSCRRSSWSSSGDSTVAVADRYTPVGGLARLVGSVELHFPMPLLSEHFQPYVFYDGGRIWTPDQPLRAQRSGCSTRTISIRRWASGSATRPSSARSRWRWATS